MTIPAGTRLGRYEIRSQLGAGGMGEVYLAQDSKLERTIALKVLPADVVRDQGRMRPLSGGASRFRLEPSKCRAHF